MHISPRYGSRSSNEALPGFLCLSCFITFAINLLCLKIKLILLKKLNLICEIQWKTPKKNKKWDKCNYGLWNHRWTDLIRFLFVLFFTDCSYLTEDNFCSENNTAVREKMTKWWGQGWFKIDKRCSHVLSVSDKCHVQEMVTWVMMIWGLGAGSGGLILGRQDRDTE